MHKKTVVIVGGPTASGKTAVALRIAQLFGTEIISADSRQCFNEMNIGVARPSPEELATVPHHFIASHSIKENVTAATFEAFALQKAALLFQHHDVVVMVGGTGLYIRAFCQGFDHIPEVPEWVRAEVRASYATMGLSWLQTEVARLDPQFFAEAENQNPQRLMRGLEVIRATGKSVLVFRTGKKQERPFDVIKIALELPKEVLHQNIDRRVDAMIEAGLEDEVRGLLPWRHVNAMQTVGYREWYPFFEGVATLADVRNKIKIATRQYAKRQLTWFRKDSDFTWFVPEEFQNIKSHLQRHVAFKTVN